MTKENPIKIGKSFKNQIEVLEGLIEGNVVVIKGNESLRDNQWHHVAFTQLVDKAVIYIDGRDPSEITIQNPVLLNPAIFFWSASSRLCHVGYF